MPRATHLQTLGDASSYTAFTIKVSIHSWFCYSSFTYSLCSSFFSHDILDPIEGDDWTTVDIIAAAAGSNDSAL